MRPGPGSCLWLVCHDVRLNVRGFTDMFARLSRTKAWFAGLAGLITLHLLAWPAVVWLQPVLDAPGSDGQILVVIGCILAWVIAQGLLGATRLLFNRGDLDLLLGSPLPGTRVFAARATALATDAFGSIALLTLPVANVGAVLYGPVWLSAYPVLAAIAMAGTACGIGLGMGLFFVVGPRHARLIAQLGAAVIAGTFVLGVQVLALLPTPMRDAILTVLGGGAGVLDQGQPLAIPVAALRGDLVAMGSLVAASAVVFALVVHGLSHAFVSASLRAAGAPTEGPAEGARRGAAVRFSAGLGRSLRRKEWRLMQRDPNLIAQLSLQMIYTVPVAVVLLNSNAGVPAVLAIGPTLVVIATQLAASLAWITVSGEDAPELIAAAPVRRDAVDRGKLVAIALPVALIIALPLAGLALISLWAAAVTLACAAGGGVSTALLNLWHPMPGKRRGMLRRHAQSKVIGLVEHGLALLWAVVMIMALLGSSLTLVPLAIVLAVLAVWYPGWPQRGPASAVSQPAATASVRSA